MKTITATKARATLYKLLDEAIIILGHGVKDIGNKESFAVTIPKDLAPDLFANVLSSFNDRWKRSASI